MAMQEIFDFGGLAPRLNAALLPDNMAQTASNVTLWNRELQPLLQPSDVVTPTSLGSTIKSIYRIGQSLGETQYWMAWTTDVNVVRGLVAGDTSERTYYTGDGAPKVTDLTYATGGGSTYPVNKYTLGIPKPANAMTCTPSSTTEPVETRVYVYTYVSGWGEEGPPSDPTEVVVSQGGTVNMSNLATGPAGAYNIVSKRVYRSQQTSTGDAIYRYVAEINIATTTINDIVVAEDLGEEISTIGYDPPPSTMLGLTALPNGMVAGLDGYDILFCEPFLPYAWPTKYRLTADYPTVGAGVIGSSLVVLTKGIGYVCSGTHPSNMSMEKIENSQGCVAKRSIVTTDDGVVYASKNGLVYVGPGGARVITEGKFKRKEWNAFLDPSTITAFWTDGKYIGVHSTGAFILEINPGGQVGELTTFDDAPTAGYVDPASDTLYLCIGGVIKKFNNGAAKTMTWRSKKFQWLGRTPPAFAKVDATSYPVTFKLYWDGTLKLTQSVTSNRPFSLPGGERPDEVYFEISGTSAVRYVGMADAFREFKIG